MLKGLFALLFILIFSTGAAQTTTLTAAEQAALDSLLKEDLFYSMLKNSLKPKSYFELSAVLGNSYFSVKNKRLEASQLESKLVFTPGISYYHKKGFGISATGFLTSFKGKSDFYQLSLTPAFSFTKSKKIAVAVSYTRFFRKKGYEDAASPVQNDLFASAYLKKPWLQPGLSMGLSAGRTTVYRFIDTVFLGSRVAFTDTMKTKIRSFSVSAFVQHTFEYYELFSKKDAIAITPKFILNAGSNSYEEKHYNKYAAIFKRIAQRRGTLGRLQYNNPFALQSIGFSGDINYVIGKFGFEPQVYLDYYLPETTDKRFTVICSAALTYSF